MVRDSTPVWYRCEAPIRPETDAHEFGHVLGFDDFYDEESQWVYPGHYGEIMAGSGSVMWYHGEVLRVIFGSR